MKKQEIINVLQGIRDSHMVWVKEAQIIVDGIKLDRLEEPVPYFECDFSHWCKLNEKKISGISWFKEIQSMHKDLHVAYSDLFYGSVRKYKPKTLNEIMKSFETIKSKSKLFKEKLDKTEADLYQMSDDEYEELLIKKIAEPRTETNMTPVDNNNSLDSDSIHHKVSKNEIINEIIEANKSKKNANEQFNNDSRLEEIDIDQYQYQNPFDELETVVVVSPVTTNEVEIETKSNVKATTVKIDDDETPEIVITPLKNESLNDTHEINPIVNVKRQISLKEQNIIQLKQEKQLVDLELTHLEQTQNLTQQSVDQLDQYYALKQEEVELEQKDNIGIITLKNDARKAAEDELSGLQEKQLDLKNVINGLERQNTEDKLKQQKDKKDVTIAKQFEELKVNKNIQLEELQGHKKSRENDLLKLKEQVLQLQEEIADMGQDIDKKQHDLLDIEEKEKIRNEELSKKKAAQEKVNQERNNTITDLQKQLDQLYSDDKSKQNDLNTVVAQIDELNKKITTLHEANSNELEYIKLQQEQKREKLLETEELRSSKQQEIKDIEIRVVGVERSLGKIKSEQRETEVDESETVTTE